MPRSRIIFLLIIGAAILFVGVVVVVQNAATSNQNAQATKIALANDASTATSVAAVNVPNPNGQSVTPVFAGGKTPTDGLPTYTCAADAFGSYYTLEQMQQAGYDVQAGFHLGIIPFLLDGDGGQYDYSEDARSSLLNSGSIDCLFTTLDSTALSGAGQITAVIDESAGADQFWARPTIKTLNDLRGKKIIYASDSVGQFFALYTLAVAGLDPKSDVTMIPADNVADAVSRFNQGQADAVSAWEPDIEKAKDGGGQYLIGSDKLRVILDVIMTARQSIQNKASLVQKFHDAWFRTLKAQFEDETTAANQIAQWGHNDWSGINAGTAANDLKTSLANIAQADLTANTAAMKDTSSLTERLDTAKRVWAAAGVTSVTTTSADLVNPTFVLQSAKENALATSGKPVNDTFFLTSAPNLKALDASNAETLAVLPCRKFDFLPNSTTLTSDAKSILDTCVLPVLHSSIGIYLQIVGSAAWLPGDTEATNVAVATSRANAVANYLTQNGIDPQRFQISNVEPPADRRGATDGSVQAQDRYVALTLITVGR